MKVFGRTPVDLHQVKIPSGQVFLIPERCKGCELCVEFCPKKTLRVSTATNQKGYHYPEVVPAKEGSCVHCDFCTLVCPEFAIYTLEVAL